jgi:outer membrane protein OmpA-like peptidoglycan-associated protein
MKNCLIVGIGVLLSIVVLAPATLAMELNATQFPERRTVDVSMEGLPGAPAGSIRAEVTFRDGQAHIVASYDSMKPAILFAGDVTCYVLWAVTRDGTTENLGEFLVDEPKGKLEFATAQKSFALIVTAEPFYLVRRPSELAMFRSRLSDAKRVTSVPFEFDGFQPAPARAMDSIANIAWDSNIPLPLLQARKAYELATRNDARTHAPQIYQEASEALERANDALRKSPGSRKLLDDARRAVALSNEAINISLHRIEGIELEQRIAARRAEMQALETRAAESEKSARRSEAEVAAARDDIDRLRGERDRTSAETAALFREKSALEADMASLRRSKEQLQREKSDLNARLEDALSHVAETKNTARGFVVSLPDILFDVNEASLKCEAKIVLAKLGGILLLIQDLGVAVEGHTDSTGSEEYNLVLSERRADSVMEFIAGEGIDLARLRASGFGMSQPVAGNATVEGRRKNRRVELVIAER